VTKPSARRLAALVAFFGLATVIARRRGYQLGPNTVVRCRDGHYFTTIWIPGASLKSIRLGWARFQRCPVGEHWTLVTPARDIDLSAVERQQAQQHRDLRIP
jgi:hypothetical protein